MRRAHRLDDNHGEIRSAFERMGCSVADLSALGNGCPDILVFFGGTSGSLIEIKDGAKPPSQRRLSPDEERWHANWKGPVDIVKDLDDVRRVVERLVKWHGYVWAGTEAAIPDQQIKPEGCARGLRWKVTALDLTEQR